MTTTANDVLSKVVNEQMGFLRSEDADVLVADMPDALVLIRTGANRYTCRMDQIEEVIEQIEDNNDYVRDVCFPSDNVELLRAGKDYIKAKGIVKKFR